MEISIYIKERKTTKIVTMWVHKNVEVIHMTTIAQNQEDNKKTKTWKHNGVKFLLYMLSSIISPKVRLY